MDKASETISVCCILHNICVDMNDKIDYSDSADSDSDHDDIQVHSNRGNSQGINKDVSLHELQISPEGIL